MSLKSNLKKKGMLSEYTCDKCENPICKCVIDKIRNMENALIVAKQALESLQSLNEKLSMEIDDERKTVEKLDEKVTNKFWNTINTKKKSIQAQVDRFRARDTLIQ
jgi:hypothetical protein